MKKFSFELEKILEKAKALKAEVYTTSKDYVKIPHILQKEIKVNNQYYFSINLATRYGDKNQLLKSDSDIKALKIKTLKRNYN